jgi:hypothetical protein
MYRRRRQAASGPRQAAPRQRRLRRRGASAARGPAQMRRRRRGRRARSSLRSAQAPRQRRRRCVGRWRRAMRSCAARGGSCSGWKAHARRQWLARTGLRRPWRRRTQRVMPRARTRRRSGKARRSYRAVSRMQRRAGRRRLLRSRRRPKRGVLRGRRSMRHVLRPQWLRPRQHGWRQLWPRRRLPRLQPALRRLLSGTRRGRRQRSSGRRQSGSHESSTKRSRSGARVRTPPGPRRLRWQPRHLDWRRSSRSGAQRGSCGDGREHPFGWHRSRSQREREGDLCVRPAVACRLAPLPCLRVRASGPRSWLLRNGCFRRPARSCSRRARRPRQRVRRRARLLPGPTACKPR